MSRFGRKNNDDNNTSVFDDDVNEITNEIVEGENVETNEVTEPEIDEVNESEETEEYRDPRVQFEEIPTSWEGIAPAANPVAYGLMTQVIGFRNSYLDDVERLESAAFDGSETNVLDLAQKYSERNPLIPSLVEVFQEAKRAYESALESLTSHVKEAANIVQLTDAERAEHVKLAREMASNIAKALDGMKTFDALNPTGTIKPAIDWYESLPALPGIPGVTTRSKTATKLGAGVSRPRLGEGYIKVLGKQYDNFSKALPVLTGKLGRNVLAPELHKAWFDAAKVSSWTETPLNTEVTFDFFGIEVTILRK
jgi:hypothetical protein